MLHGAMTMASAQLEPLAACAAILRLSYTRSASALTCSTVRSVSSRMVSAPQSLSISSVSCPSARSASSSRIPYIQPVAPLMPTATMFIPPVCFVHFARPAGVIVPL